MISSGPRKRRISSSDSDGAANKPSKKPRPRAPRVVDTSADESDNTPIVPRNPSKPQGQGRLRTPVGEKGDSSSTETDSLFRDSGESSSDDDRPLRERNIARKDATITSVNRSSSADEPLSSLIAQSSVSAPATAPTHPVGGRYNPPKEAKVKRINIPIPKKKDSASNSLLSSSIAPPSAYTTRDHFVDSPTAMSPPPAPVLGVKQRGSAMDVTDAMANTSMSSDRLAEIIPEQYVVIVAYGPF